ncbi:MAG: hypothetical protein KDC35_18515 [Acidobacteria bacterium]|nr:hypothetical protein [Acidobacteriota bacterium]
MLFVLLFFCQESSCFEVVLAKEGQEFRDIVGDPTKLLEQLEWEDAPVLTLDDLVLYVWNSHAMYLHRGAMDQMPKLRDVASFRYFKVRANGKDLYVGVILPVRSQRRGDLPVIRLLGDSRLWLAKSGSLGEGGVPAEKTTVINQTVTISLNDSANLTDPRFDENLRQCLERASKLRD